MRSEREHREQLMEDALKVIAWGDWEYALSKKEARERARLALKALEESRRIEAEVERRCAEDEAARSRG